MIHISGHDRSQMFLLPESVDDYVGADNPVRFNDAFVDELDLAAAASNRPARTRDRGLIPTAGDGRPYEGWPRLQYVSHRNCE
jgi:hypothetical protein